MFDIHIPIWQHGSCIHLSMATKPPSILINSLHPNNAIQITLLISQNIQYDYDQIQSTPVHYTLHLHLFNRNIQGHLVRLEQYTDYIDAQSYLILDDKKY